MSEADADYKAEKTKRCGFVESRFFAGTATRLYKIATVWIESLSKEIEILSQNLDCLEDHESEDAREISKRLFRAKASLTEYLKMKHKLVDDFADLAGSLMEYVECAVDIQRVDYLIDELFCMIPASQLRKELRERRNEDVKELTIDDLLGILRNKLLSPEILYLAAKKHHDRLSLQEQKLEAITKQTKDEFKEAVRKAVQEGWLPGEAEFALFRIDDVVVKIEDALLLINSGQLASIDNSGQIYVNTYQLEPELIPRLKKTLFHEFLHAISGKSITMRKSIEEAIDFRHEVTHILHRKEGLALYKKEFKVHKPNNWLNEAVTEWLALRLSGYHGDTDQLAYNGSYSYSKERSELDRLFSLDLSSEVVTNAYFENIISDQPPYQRARHYAQLVNDVNQADGRFAFNRLDNKFMLRDLENDLNEYVVSNQESPRSADEVGKSFSVRITIGYRAEVSFSNVYTFRLYEADRGVEIIPPEKTLEDIQKILKRKYGKVEFELLELLAKTA